MNQTLGLNSSRRLETALKALSDLFSTPEPHSPLSLSPYLQRQDIFFNPLCHFHLGFRVIDAIANTDDSYSPVFCSGLLNIAWAEILNRSKIPPIGLGGIHEQLSNPLPYHSDILSPYPSFLMFPAALGAFIHHSLLTAPSLLPPGQSSSSNSREPRTPIPARWCSTCLPQRRRTIPWRRALSSPVTLLRPRQDHSDRDDERCVDRCSEERSFGRYAEQDCTRPDGGLSDVGILKTGKQPSHCPTLLPDRQLVHGELPSVKSLLKKHLIKGTSASSPDHGSHTKAVFRDERGKAGMEERGHPEHEIATLGHEKTFMNSAFQFRGDTFKINRHLCPSRQMRSAPDSTLNTPTFITWLSAIAASALVYLFFASRRATTTLPLPPKTVSSPLL
ncbi:hypothetical protein BKA70DRAFT_1556882 [Coprinopsis sp. MPI-PUGE-AT-0042]|nr:hypothetical protein BKA70DRAFT_1556882 [Coprinopsis sp. MPI-PUGE-AT-0042]